MMGVTYQKIQKDGANALNYQNEYVRDLRKVIEGNKENLLTQSEFQGEIGDQAREILKLYDEIKDIPELDRKIGQLQQEYAKSLTQVMGSMDDIWTKMKAGILGRLLPLVAGPLRAIAEGITKFAKSPAWDNVSKNFQKLGDRLEAWIKSVMTDANMNMLTNWVASAITAVSAFVGGLTAQDFSVVASGLKIAMEGGKVAFEALGVIATGVFKVLSLFEGHVKEVVIVLASLFALKKAVDIFKFFSTLKEMKVAATNVYVNGKPIGGGLGGGNDRAQRGGQHDRGNPRRPRPPRAGGRGLGAALGMTGQLATGLASLGIGAGLVGGVMELFSDAVENTTERVNDAAETLGTPMDDLKRGLLDNKHNLGTITESEERERQADIELRRKLRRYCSALKTIIFIASRG
ncbi:MAG: hypothetical protein EOP83_30010 [Verrucomicrobiaceae bacterium]|nr:MAG: hypothetical protein EOP83_30010 [Verrucomicrobiaceae bacterium]